MSKTIYDVLPYAGVVDDKYLLFKDGRIGVVYERNHVDYDLQDPKEIIGVCDILYDWLQDIPDYFDVQFFDSYYGEIYNGRNLDNDVLSLYDESFLGKEFMESKTYILFVYSKNSKNASLKINPYNSNLIKTWSTDSIDKGLKDKDILDNFVKNALSYLSQIKFLKLTLLNEEKINNLALNYCNLDFTSDELNYFSSNYRRKDDCLLVGDKKVKIVSYNGNKDIIKYTSVSDYSEPVHQPKMYQIGYNLQFPHIVVTNIKKIKKSDFKRKFIMESQIAGLNFPHEFVRKNVEIDEQVKKIVDSDENIFDVNIQVILYSKDEKQLGANLTILENKLKAIQLNYIVEDEDTANLFFLNVPGETNNYRNIILPATYARTFINFVGGYNNTDGNVLFTDRYGKPYPFSYRDKNIAILNSATFAPTGAGKSYNENNKIINSHFNNEYNIIFDKGRSYEPLVRTLGGDFIELGTGELRTNPFIQKKIDKENKSLWVTPNLTTDNELLDSYKDHKLYLYSLLSFLYKKNENSNFNVSEESIFDILIDEYYNSKNNLISNDKDGMVSLPDFVEYIHSYFIEDKIHEILKIKKDSLASVFNIDIFRLNLNQFTRGMYKHIFSIDDKNMLNDLNRLTCFETTKIKDDPTLYPLYTMLAVKQTLIVLEKKQNYFKNLRMDEVWDMFYGNLLSVIIYAYRTIRKLNGAIDILSQNITDVNPELLRIIGQNSGIFTILNSLGQENFKQSLRETLGLSDHEISLIESMRFENDAIGREQFLRISKKVNYKGFATPECKVVSLKVPRGIDGLFTTTPEHKQLFSSLLIKNNNDYFLTMKDYERQFKQ